LGWFRPIFFEQKPCFYNLSALEISFCGRLAND
jgi:hypothetical protein